MHLKQDESCLLPQCKTLEDTRIRDLCLTCQVSYHAPLQD